MSFTPLVGSFGQWLKRHRETNLDMTQAAFANAVLCSIATIQSYEQGRVAPSKEAAQRIAEFIAYPNIEEFVRFARQNRYYGHSAQSQINGDRPELALSSPLAIPAEQWPIALAERFKNNDQRWGLGVKDDGVGMVHRMIANGAYMLTLIPRSARGCFLAGDSIITAPETFYLTVEVERIEGPASSSGGIAFEELHDHHLALFHARNEAQQFAVWQFHQRSAKVREIMPWQQRADLIRLHGMNKFGLLAAGERFTFFLNNVEVGRRQIARTPGARLDLAIGGMKINERIVYTYRNFFLRTPPM